MDGIIYKNRQKVRVMTVLEKICAVFCTPERVAWVFLAAVALWCGWYLVKYWVGKSALQAHYVCLFSVAAAAFILRFYVNRALPPWENVSFSFVEMMRYFALEADSEPLKNAAAGLLGTGLQWTHLLLLVAAPLCTATLFLRLLRGQWRRVLLSLLSRRPVYYFSELNEKSFSMATSIWEEWKDKKRRRTRKPALVFCKMPGEGEAALHKDAERLGAVFFRSYIHAIPIEKGKRRQVSLFLIDMKEEENSLSLLRLKERLQEDRRKPCRIYLCSTLASAEPLVDSLREKLPLHLIHETRMAAHKLLLEKPLYEACRGDKLPVLIVGGGSLGTEVLKAAIVCGTLRNCRLSVKVVDKDAEYLKARFFRDRGYGDKSEGEELAKLWQQVKPEFITADVTTDSLNTVLKDCGESSYIVIATGDDERNCDVARYISRWYAREKGEQPAIHVVVRNPKRCESECFPGDKTQAFGSNTEIYKLGELLERKLDRAAMLFDAMYTGTFDADAFFSGSMWEQWEAGFWKDPVSYQYSNQLAALHSKYKVHMLCSDLDSPGPKKVVERFADALRKGKAEQRQLLTLEHERWSLFHIIEGWQRAMPEQLKKLKADKDRDNKLHGCLMDAEHLGMLKTCGGKGKDCYDSNDCKIWVGSPLAWMLLEGKEEKSDQFKKKVEDLWEIVSEE